MNRDLLSQILDINSCSGFESKMMDFICKYTSNNFRELVLEREQDWIQIRNKKQGCPTLCIFAHIDEVGLIVEEKCQSRFKVKTIGSIPISNYLGRLVYTAEYEGIIEPECESDIYLNNETKELYVNFFTEIPFTSKIIGNSLHFVNPYHFSVNKIISKGLDNKIGIYLALSLLKTISTIDKHVSIIFTTKEEISGSKYPKNIEHSEINICVDAFSTLEDDCQLGEGLVISLPKGSDSNDYFRYERLLTYEKIKYQKSTVTHKTGTEIDKIEDRIKDYVIISYPTSNMHTLNEIVSISDIEHTEAALDLLLKTLPNPPRQGLRTS